MAPVYSSEAMGMSGGVVNASDIAPVQWRTGMLKLMLRVSVVLGFFVYLPSVYLAIKSGLIGVVIVDTVVMALVTALLVLDRLPYLWRASFFCMLIYALGIVLLIAVGASRQGYLFGFSIIATLLLGVRAGLGSAVIASLTLFVVGAVGHSMPGIGQSRWSEGLTSWFVVTLNFALVDILMTLAIGSVLKKVEDGLRTEIATRTALEGERALLRTLFDSLPDVVVRKDINSRYVMANNAALKAFGVENESDVVGKTVFEILPRERAEMIHADDISVMAGSVLSNHESTSVDPNGNPYWYLTIKAPLRDAHGEVCGLIGISRNITDRRQLEEQLRQAQKMEAVGQLAGGVAHDFNNLLTVIIGYTEVLMMQPELDSLTRDSVKAIGDAGERAASLTRRLLAFSRRSILQPRVVDVNALVSETERLLVRLIGEDINFSTVLTPGIDRVRVDPGQLDQVLVNLVVNARDAMPQGGRLTIETANVEFSEEYADAHPGFGAGHHVMLAVSDTGIGMTPEVKARIFEPFFTTKGLGNGTGLGLAMVFGTVEQSGGHIHVYSEPGQGSTFKIYFPAVTDDLSRAAMALSTADLSGTETVLLVEDDAAVRELAYVCLRSHGYAVLTATDGQDALRCIDAHHGRIDALVTDVVMPNISGPELAATLTNRFAHLKVLFMSGYTDDAVVRHGLLQADVAFIQKPYSSLALAQKLRHVLDG